MRLNEGQSRSDIVVWNECLGSDNRILNWLRCLLGRILGRKLGKSFLPAHDLNCFLEQLKETTHDHQPDYRTENDCFLHRIATTVLPPFDLISHVISIAVAMKVSSSFLAKSQDAVSKIFNLSD